MQKTQKSPKSMTGHAFTQFDLTKSLLQNLNKFEISPIAKLVLLELSSHYNPKHADIFPKQKTLALKIGCSERSVVRAIQELFKAGIILIECKHTNRYIFSLPRLFSLGILNDLNNKDEKNFADENLSDTKCQNDTKQYDNLSPACIRTNNKEQITQQRENFYLFKFAKQRGAKNKIAYINAIKKNGGAAQIIQEVIQAENRGNALYKDNQEFLNRNEEYKQNASTEMPQFFKDFRTKLEAYCKQ